VAKKTPRTLIALSSSAIAAIYLAGFVATRGADASLNAAASPAGLAAAPAAAAGPPLVPSPAAGSVASVPTRGAASQPAAPATATPTSGYRDGTYTGSGDSRRGGFTVAVTIQGGRIADVKITDAWTQYPVSRVAALPGEIIARQAPVVDRVTGATYSAMAFQQAVAQALAQASTGGAPAVAAQASAPSAGAASAPSQTSPAPAVVGPGRPARPYPGQLYPRQRERDGRGDREDGRGYRD
jgi:uncharacterized protein with FMN-binding domain